MAAGILILALMLMNVFQPAVSKPKANCGKRIEEFGHQAMSYIIGGQDASAEQFPWQVSIRDESASDPSAKEHICGGALILPNWVLTASHCLYE